MYKHIYLSQNQRKMPLTKMVWFLIFLGDLEFQKIKQGSKDIVMQK